MSRWSDGVRAGVLVGAAVLFAVPLVASAVFGFSSAGAVTAEPLLDAVASPEFWPDALASLLLAVLTTLAVLVLLVPTLFWLHLRAPRLLGLTEALSVLPLVVPAVALVNGVNLAFRATVPGFLVSLYSLVPFYVVLVMPLVYRALDGGFRAVDLPTLVNASTSLGAGPFRTFFAVVLPNLRQAVVNAALLTTALVLGEFALATLLLHDTYPVFLAQIGQDSPRAAAALAVLTLVGTWALLAGFTRLAGRRPGAHHDRSAPAFRTATTPAPVPTPALERTTS
ncbi:MULTISPECIES: ABC transporter permease subunit [unclassified Curtobacterium]|uniref:ABC transporter permease n=1 Tax=unclassified Curtobacterium TaxID=257496 RepID=UPI000D920BEE|nr:MULTISPECIES: ABC transporter permease subunit [unclassified Curtobacterium]PYY55878.1 ABC transporter permease [Curtobacterium sp. MCSS17_011]WIE79210.1 ABC transporter permease subunit [Curtobacterium sp. MCSS17_016]